MLVSPVVGLLATLRPGVGAADLAAAASLAGTVLTEAHAGGALPLVSPWAGSNSLARVVWQDIFGDLAIRPVTRAEAMRVPAMSRARHIITGAARIELRAYRGDSEDPLPPADAAGWLTSTSGALSPLHRMIWTLDDLVFYGWSCWSRVNSVYDGFPLRCDRVPMDRWSVDAGGQVRLDRLDGAGFQPVNSDEVILIPGPHEGLLSFAAGSIRHAADLQRAASKAAQNPAAYLALRQTAGIPLTDPEIDALIARWAAARNGDNGGVAWLNQSVEAQELGTFDAHLVVEGRNAAAVDIARHASIPADLIDAASEASLTYSNSRDNDRRAIDWGIGSYLAAVSSALSQDTVTPRGTRLAFDLEKWLEGTVPGQPAGAPAAPVAGAPVTPAAMGETAV